MNILHVIGTLNSRYGGPVSVLWGLAVAQVRRGHQVTIYTSGDEGRSFSKSIDPLTKSINIFSFAVSIKPILFSLRFYRYLKNSIDSFDIIHIHGLYRFPVTYAASLARKKGIPYIIRPHGSLDPFLYRQSRFGKWAVPIKRMYEHLFDLPNLNNASAIHFTAKEEMERTTFLKLRAPAVIIPNGIDWQQYSSLPIEGQFRSRIGLGAQTPLVLFLGRINFKKGLDLLIPSFARVLETVPEARLAIVGPDNEGYGLKVRQWCREQGIADKVFFVDHLGQEEVKQAYVDADVFVLPSYTENFGMTVVEAMACACPVVISDQVNIWREVKEEGAGLVVGLNPAEIADAIKRILADKAASLEMGRRGRLAAERRYSWSQIVDQMIQVYQSLIKQKMTVK